jgi:hypothetical protein
LLRFDPPGCGASVGRLHAHVDIWINPDMQLLIRFSHAGYKHYFRVRLPRRVTPARLQPQDLCDYLAEELYEWLDAARLGDF